MSGTVCLSGPRNPVIIIWRGKEMRGYVPSGLIHWIVQFPIFHNVDDTWALQSWKIDINWFTLFQLNSLTKESCHWSTTLFSRYQVGNNFEDLRASFWASQGLADTAGLSRTHLTFLECTDSCCWSDLRSFQGQQSSCCWRLVNLFTGVELQARDRVDS